MTNFIMAPARLVKGENQFPEFREILPALLNAAKRRAAEVWPGFTEGGALPTGGQYGIEPFRPRDIYGGGTATFSKRYGSAGSWCNIFSYQVPRDILHAYAGIAFTDPNLIFAAIQMQVEDKIFPVTNIEEAHSYQNGFALLFKQDAGKEWVIPELQPVKIMGFQERNTAGMTQRIVPLGFSLYKNKQLAIVQQEVNN